MANLLRCLILTSKTGGGHVSLAEALRDRLGSDYTVEIIDPQPPLFHVHYRLASRHALWLWSAEFRLSDSPATALVAHRIFTRLVQRSLRDLLVRFQPDVIITTYAFLSYEVMRVLERLHSAVPLAMLYSDPADIHAAWLTERSAAAILAPTRETFDQARSVGISPHRLHLVGWPVRAQFYQAGTGTRADTLIQLNLDPERFTVFLQGGGEGAAKIGRTVESVLAASKKLQVILAAGTNRALSARYQSVPNIHVLPYTRDVAPFMAAADIVMGKAGPNALFESVTLGKPFVATAYIPGQEEANPGFIQQHGLGWVALEREKQHELITRLIRSPDQLREMEDTVDGYRQWNSAANQAIEPLIRSLPTRGLVPSL